MRFCVNCAAPYQREGAICAQCWLDQRVPESHLRAEIAAPAAPRNLPFLGFPGETLALCVALVVSSIVIVALGIATLGAVLLLTALSATAIYLELLKTKRHFIAITPSNLPRHERLAVVAAHRLGIRPPLMFVRNDPEANAYATGFGSWRYIVVNSGLLNDFPPEEILFVFGHEMGHLRQGHTAWLMLLEPARVGGQSFVLAPLLRFAFNLWSVKAEHTADQAGLIACRSLDVAVSALVRVAGGMTIDSGASIVLSAAEAASLEKLLEYAGTHPFLTSRVEQLNAFAASPSVAIHFRGPSGQVII